jgi:hypothetical protein
VRVGALWTARRRFSTEVDGPRIVDREPVGKIKSGALWRP